ncbi:MAG: tetratricopeptide repeat protein [Gemmatimonadota bacterium]
MSHELECARFEAAGTIVKYVARTIEPAEGAAFEDHLIICERCQTSVRAGSGARQHFQSGGTIVRNRGNLRWLVGLPAAASLAALIASRGIETAQLKQLGVVDAAPLYLGVPVRGDDEEALRFDSAMAAYNAGDYQAALRHFDALRDGGVVVDFFAGVSELMLKRAGKAETRLSRVIAAGNSPYYAEALYYRAKSYLQQRRKAHALADLRAAGALQSPLTPQAEELLNELEH